MKAFKLSVLTFLVLMTGICFGQQQVMYTQYMFNGLALNPAYAGSHESISVTALAREQWTGLDGAPSTQTLSIHSPVKNERVGVGLLFLHDKIGVTDQTGIYTSYSYKLPFEDGSTLAMGLQGGVTFYNARFSEVSDVNPAFANGDVREVHPNFGFGAYYTKDRLFAGFSIPQLMHSSFDRDNEDSDSWIVRHYFASAGYVFDLNPDLKLKPHVLMKAVKGAPVEFDVNASVLIKERVWLGVSWRSFDSFDALFQIQVNNQLQFGYSYDFATTTELRRVNSGSHEIMLNYRFAWPWSKKEVAMSYF